MQNWWDFGIDIIQNLCYIKTIKRTHERETEMETIINATRVTFDDNDTGTIEREVFQELRHAVEFVGCKDGTISFEGKSVYRYEDAGWYVMENGKTHFIKESDVVEYLI